MEAAGETAVENMKIGKVLNSVHEIILLYLSAMIKVNSKSGFAQMTSSRNWALSHSLKSNPITMNDEKVQEHGSDSTTNFFLIKLKLVLKTRYLT